MMHVPIQRIIIMCVNRREIVTHVYVSSTLMQLYGFESIWTADCHKTSNILLPGECDISPRGIPVTLLGEFCRAKDDDVCMSRANKSCVTNSLQASICLVSIVVITDGCVSVLFCPHGPSK